MKQKKISGKPFERIVKGLAEIVPEPRRKKIVPMLQFAGISQNFDFWLGKKILTILIAMFLGIVFSLGLLNFVSFDFPSAGFEILLVIGSVIGFGFAGFALSYLHLYYLIEGRSNFAEKILPDFLLLVASNINAGMTPFIAFRSAARPEFGALSSEIRIATAKSLGTESFASALKRLPLRIKSRALQEIVYFFTEAMKSGGKLAKLLETTAFDLRQTQEMQKELLTSTRMYVVFIAFLIIVGAPLLLAVSTQFLTMISVIQAENPIGTAEDLGTVAFLSSELAITPEFMTNIAFILLLGNALLAGIFIGVIGKGKLVMGLRYSPIIFVASLAIFLASNAMLGLFLGIG